MILSETYRIRQLHSSHWVCEIVRIKQFLWFEPYTVVVGYSGLFEYPIGSRDYGSYCVGSKYSATENLRILEDANGI